MNMSSPNTDPDTRAESAHGSEARVRAIALDDEWVCFDRETGRLLVTNEVGRLMWHGLIEGHPRARIVSDIEARFSAPPGAVAADLEAFVLQLRGDAQREADRAAGPGAPILDPTPVRAPHWRCRSRWPSAVGDVVIESESREVIDGLNCLLGGVLVPLASSFVPSSDDTVLQVWKEGERFPFVYHGATIDTGLGLRDAVGRLSRIGAGLLAARDGWIAALHAAVVERDGEAIVLPAASGTGKTTLTAWLVGQGRARLVNDELAILRPRDMAHPPVAYPLSIKSGSVPLLAPLWPSLEHLPVRLDRRGREIRELVVPPERTSDRLSRAIAIVQLNRIAGDAGAEATLGVVSRAETFRSLICNDLSFSSTVNWRGIVSLVRWLAALPSLRLDYADLAEAARALDTVWDGSALSGQLTKG